MERSGKKLPQIRVRTVRSDGRGVEAQALEASVHEVSVGLVAARVIVGGHGQEELIRQADEGTCMRRQLGGQVAEHGRRLEPVAGPLAVLFDGGQDCRSTGVDLLLALARVQAHERLDRLETW